MSKERERRLQALERVAAPMLGFRYFQQSATDPELFKESGPGGPVLTLGEIDALSAAGWRCVVIMYEAPPEAKNVIRLTWGDEQPGDGAKSDENSY